MGTKPKHNIIQTHPSSLTHFYPRILSNNSVFSKSLQKGWFRKRQSIPDGNHAQPLDMILQHHSSLTYFYPRILSNSPIFSKSLQNVGLGKVKTFRRGTIPNHTMIQTHHKLPYLLSQGKSLHFYEGYHQPKQKTYRFDSDWRTFIYLY